MANGVYNKKCQGRELNPHGRETTGFWDQRVYQFRHLGIKIKSGAEGDWTPDLFNAIEALSQNWATAPFISFIIPAKAGIQIY